ncbi:MAG TPA: EF-P lysine aminoacylase EpmA [Gammaproteobacteria bacterium]|nr:EF-P lysine aminoacylase EpmA [Gammaproteobacteria bacterium]
MASRDPDWRPTASLDVLRLRAELLVRIRAFFATRGVLEVETPVLSAAAAPDPHLTSPVTRLTAAGGGTFYLHTSPEYPMKRLLAAGYGDIWQLCRVFRDGERGARHNPEFTLLEWYRIGFDHHTLMNEVSALLRQVLDGHLELGADERLTYREAFRRHAGLDPFEATDETLRAAVQRLGGETRGLARDALLDFLGGHVVYPALGHGRPTFLYDFPASQAALARVRDDDPAVAERFEVFVDGIELANGYHELADAREQRARFERHNRERAAAGLPVMPLDERLLAALAHGLPDCAGVALGFDRLVMLAAGARRIEEVIAFPVERA